jgi:6-phosphogluconolactonase (cycloisomerase 2 family)
MGIGRLGLIGGNDTKRLSGIYSLDENISRENSKNFLTTFSYDGKFNALTQAGAAQGFTFSSDGTILLVCTPGTRTTAKITEWSLGTPFDITTATYQAGRDFLCGDYDINVNSIFYQSGYPAGYYYFGGTTNDTIWIASYDYGTSCLNPFVTKFYLGTQDATPRSTRFSSDGFTMFSLGGTNRNIYQYSINPSSAPYDINNASYANKTLAVTQDATPQNIFFKSDGFKAYMLGSTSQAIYSYSLPNQWDLTGATSDYSAPVSFQTSGQATAPRSVYIGNNGTRMYVLSYVAGSPTVYQYTLNTPYDPSSAVYSPAKFLNVNARDTEPWEIFFNDIGSKMYLLGSTNDAIYSYSLSPNWDIGAATITAASDYVPRSYTVTTQATEPCNIFIGGSGANTGRILFVLNQATNAVFQYTLGTAYDVTTATYASKTVSVSAQDTDCRGLYFSSSGDKMYILGNTNDIVWSYTLSIPWDIGGAVTADYVSKSYLVSTQVADPYSAFIGDNGTKMYVLAGGAATTDTIFQYTLTTPWDVSTANYTVPKSFSVNTQSTSSQSIFISKSTDPLINGKKLYVINDSTDSIFQYTLSTAWDISTASYDNVSFSVTAQETVPAGMYISPDGQNMYVIGSTGDDVNQYFLSSPWNISTASFIRVSASINDATPQGIFFSDDGTKMFVAGAGNNTIQEYSLDTVGGAAGSAPWNVSNITLRRTLSTSFLDATVRDLFFGDNGTKIYIPGDTNNRVYQIDLSVAWQVTAVKGRYVVSGEETACTSMYISPDGLRMYITGQTGDDVNQYDLSVAWDTSSATFVRVSATHGEATPTGLFFKDDGSRMYIIGTTLDYIREFTLSTPWDVSTISLARTKFVGNFDGTINGIHISPDGNNLYLTGGTNNTIYQFSLSQPWRSTYLTGYTTVQPEETTALGMYISPDGLNLYVTGNVGADVNQYLLDVAWDISTAHFVRVSAAIGDSQPRGIFFSSDGTRMHVTGQTNDHIREFTLSTPWNVSTATLTDVFYYGHIAGSVTTLHFSPDGLYMYFINGTLVYRWTLAIAWRSNNVVGMYSVNREETVPTAFHFSSDGTSLYVTGQTGDDVNQYSLSTPWDITTITYTRVSAGHGEATVTGLTIDENNGYLYVCGSTLDTIRRFSISNGDVSTMSFVDSASIGFEATSSGLTLEPNVVRIFLTGTTNDCVYGIFEPFSSAVFYTNGAAGYAYIGGSEANVRSLSIPSTTWEGTLFTGGSAIRKYTSSFTPQLESISLSQTFAITEPYGVAATPHGKRLYVTLGTTTADKTGRSIRVVNMTTPFDLTTATLDSVEVIGAPGLLGNPANLWNIYVTPDEMRMFVLSPTVQGIYQFSRRFA